MGNCLGLCDIFGSTDRSRVFVRVSRAIQTSVASVGRYSARGQNYNRNNRFRRSSLPIVAGSIVTVLDEATDDVKLHYDLGEELGSGQFGVIRFCYQKHTGEKFACKSIAKGLLYRQKDVDNIRGEIQIMRQLAGHPNIVEVKDVYEDDTWVHIVMKLCEGGDLFESIFEKKTYSEKEAATTCKTLMEALVYCHSHGVVHRDLKPENILLENKHDPTTAKLADFGLAVKFLPGERLFGIAGSAYYIAPEVLKGEYGEEVDVWSAGVVLYILLSGVPPFWGDTEEAIFEAIKFGHLDLSSDPWPHISAAAKDLIKGILRHDIKKRLTSSEVLNHPWIVEHTQTANLLIPSASLPVCIKPSRPGGTETCTFLESFHNVSEARDHPVVSVASPSDDHVERVGSFRANSIISASLPKLRCTADGLVQQVMLQRCSLPEISKIHSLELGASIIPSCNIQARLNKILTTVNSSQEGIGFPCVNFSSTMLQKKHSCTLLETDGPQTCSDKVPILHDSQLFRIGRNFFKEKETITSATVSDCSKKLLWMPDSYDGHAHTKQQQQLVC